MRRRAGSIERHKLWMLICAGGGFGLLALLLAVQDAFFGEAGERAQTVLRWLIKLSAMITIAGLLILLPTYALRWRLIEGGSLWSPGGLLWLAAVAVGVAAIAVLAVVLVA